MLIQNFIIGQSYEDKNGLAEIKAFCDGNTSNSFNNEAKTNISAPDHLNRLL